MINDFADFLIFAFAGIIFGYCFRVIYDNIFLIVTEVFLK